MMYAILRWLGDKRGTAAIETGLVFSLFTAPMVLVTGEFIYLRGQSNEMREDVHTALLTIAQAPENYTNAEAEVLIEQAAGTGANAVITNACEDPDRLYSTGGAEGDQTDGYCGPEDEQIQWRAVTVTRPYTHVFFDGLAKNDQIAVTTVWRLQ
ncbi:MAG: hypothetical protein MRY64_13600 [Hyphomonadaceae bacterium]|nr:hypothetical protein [Hyphomonadaceae bacterium]